MKSLYLITLTALAFPLSAQMGSDPREKMQEILDEVATEMQQIDKWLQETSRSKAAAAGMKQNVDKLNKLLDSVGKSQQSVVKGIDDLLKEAQKMKDQQKKKSSSSSSQKQKQSKEQESESQRKERDRKERQQKRQLERPNPQGKSEQQPQDGQRPEGGQEKPDPGQNTDSKAPNQGETEKVNGKKIQGLWGGLPDYILRHGKGTMPTVPDKYRKYLEAMTKDGDKKKR